MRTIFLSACGHLEALDETELAIYCWSIPCDSCRQTGHAKECDLVQRWEEQAE